MLGEAIYKGATRPAMKLGIPLVPLVVLVAVLIGAELMGVTGVLLALPAAAAGRVGFDYAMDRRAASVAPPGPGHEVLAPDPEPAERGPATEEA